MKRIALLALALAASVASAQAAPTYTAKIAWTAPTTRTDGTTITRPLTYRVCSGATCQAPVSVTQTTWDSAVPGQCFQIVAIVDNVESDPASNCGATKPGAVTGISISFTVTIKAP